MLGSSVYVNVVTQSTAFEWLFPDWDEGQKQA